MKFPMEGSTPAAVTAEGASRFELAPPRRFILPAILLLLTEQPGYGYGLVPRLEDLRFGHVDRPAIYRALAQLEQDGLVEASAQDSRAGQSRRVYSVTALGERVLRIWMGVVKEEHAYLGQVIRRYQATGTTDAVLAEVEGGWTSALGNGWSPVSPTSMDLRRLIQVESEWEDAAPAPSVHSLSDEGCRGEPRRRFRLDPERSAVLIDARSTVGPITFGTVGVSGTIDAAVADGVVQTHVSPSGRLTIDVTGLTSGNHLYDAELLRRIDARRFPTATVELQECTPSDPGSRYHLTGELTIHGVTRAAEGTVCVEALSDHRLAITGEQVFDIRDFSIPSPTVLMLRIYPDIRVRLHAEAELDQA
jgi:DNA-binding PadR family transcriptional regulator/polyisoprenoid-binding protein YceI